MKHFERHLTDEEIQAYLDKEPGVDQKSIQSHLASCARCRKEAKVYQSLFKGLKDDTGLMLSADFAVSVVSKIEGEARDTFELWENGLIFGLVIAGISSTFYFTGWGVKLWTYFQTLDLDLTLPEYVKELPFASGEYAFWIGVTCLVLTFFGVLDKFVLETRHR